MTSWGWREEPVSKSHDRAAFDCGDEAMNTFFRRYARQNHESGGSKTFLAIDAEDGAILGFYSLAPASIAFDRSPETVQRGLPQHDVPGFRLARLAVSAGCQGRGLGGQLLVAAGRRCLRAAAEVGGVMLLIDAKSERAARWYAGFGAKPLQDAPLTLAMPLSAIAGLKIAGSP